MGLAICFHPNAASSVVNTPSGGAYPITGPTVDIPVPDADTIQPDQATKLMVVDATTDRLVNDPGRMNWPPREMFDTTLDEPIFLVPGSNPASWVNIWGWAV
jgi:hypothetical protein